jgi:hypothetical protein
MTGQDEQDAFRGWFEDAWRWVEYRDAEVKAAQARHPAQADLLFHAWNLLELPHWMPPVEFVYRGYIRELLDRVAAGEDTRPGTAAEVALGCARFVTEVKPPQVVTGLLHRMWMAAWPDHPAYDGLAETAKWLEWDCGTDTISAVEADLRRILRQPARRLPADITCDRDHGPCRFKPAAEPAA